MHRLASSSRDSLRPPLWNGHVRLGKFSLHLSLNRKEVWEETYVPLSRIANRVAVLRQEYGLSCDELAHLVDIHPSTLSALEDGSYLPSLELALRLSAFFALSIETIFSSPSDENFLM
jgi:putative transcriptional regulator